MTSISTTSTTEEKLEALTEVKGWTGRGCIRRVLRGKHVLVIGATGTGKTWWMAAVARRYLHRFIFINPNLEDIVEHICTQQYEEPADVINGLLEGELRIEFVPAEDTSIALKQMEELRLGLFGLAAEMDMPSGKWWLNFIVDEAQTYAWKGSREDLDVFARRGRRYGIRSWFLTQRPQNISSTICNNVENQIIFRTGPYERTYFKNYKIPIEAEMEWLKKQYHYVLYDGFDTRKCLPVIGFFTAHQLKSANI